jgi:hypothetical protein
MGCTFCEANRQKLDKQAKKDRVQADWLKRQAEANEEVNRGRLIKW